VRLLAFPGRGAKLVLIATASTSRSPARLLVPRSACRPAARRCLHADGRIGRQQHRGVLPVVGRSGRRQRPRHLDRHSVYWTSPSARSIALDGNQRRAAGIDQHDCHVAAVVIHRRCTSELRLYQYLPLVFHRGPTPAGNHGNEFKITNPRRPNARTRSRNRYLHRRRRCPVIARSDTAA